MYRLYSFLAILFIALNLSADNTRKFPRNEAISAEMAQTLTGNSAKVKQIFAYKQSGMVAALYSVGSQRMPQDLLVFWREAGSELVLIRQVLSEKGESYLKPEIFKLNEYTFVNISTEPAGSGGFVADSIYFLAPDGSMHEVPFQQASEIYEQLAASDQTILTGGEREFYVEDSTMKFAFWIAQPGDPHCCPSGGPVTGTYRLTGSPNYDSFSRSYRPNFNIVVDQIETREGSAEVAGSSKISSPSAEGG